MKWTASIRSKLTIIIAGISMTTIGLGFIVVSVSFHQSLKESLESESIFQAKRLARDSTVYMEKLGPAARAEILEKTALSAPHSIAIFENIGSIFVQLERGSGYISQADFQSNADVRWDNRWLHVYEPIVDDFDDQLGTLYLRVLIEPMVSKVRSFILTLVALFIIMLAIALALARGVQKYISVPLVRLENISNEVSTSQNYSLRVPIESQDEIGKLSRTFNDMLETIERRQRERDAAEEALQLNKRRLERAVKDLQYLANYDSLTQLPNRALCMDRIRYALKRASRSRTFAAILFLDLDHFKDVNDSLGHAVGDELLKAASGRLQEVLREEDTLARLGGDEFVIILNEVSDSESIITVVEKIVDSFNQHFKLSSYMVNSTVSVGVCVYPNDGSDVDELMKAADAAMYKAKEFGRNTYAFYESEMNEIALRRHRIANDLRMAIENGELSLVFQPQIDIAKGKMMGAEALLRWTHTDLGFISPGEFVPIAESTGLIKKIGMWVIDTACAELQRWRQRGHTELTIAVNLSAVQFRQTDLPELISMTLKKYELPAESLELEITESMLMRDVEQAIRILQRLKRMGFQLAIDDFGTGFSSLSYLRRFPLDSLKIDRTFIDEVCVDPDDTAITLAILSMAKSLRLNVIAEGVETIQQWDFLSEHGCDYAQGFLISKGLSDKDILPFIESFSTENFGVAAISQ